MEQYQFRCSKVNVLFWHWKVEQYQCKYGKVSCILCTCSKVNVLFWQAEQYERRCSKVNVLFWQWNSISVGVVR